jgi:tetratricopeptide (TPR) repeat protein
VIVALALTSHSLVSAAAPAPEDPVLSPEAEADWKQAEQLFRQGSARYSAADYAGAITAFQTALELLAMHEFDRAVEFALLLNLARAHRRAFEVDKAVTHLRTAMEIYRRLERVTGEDSDEHAEAVSAMPELAAQIAALEADPEPVEAEPIQSEPVVAPESRPSRPEREDASGRGLVIGGGVALGLGVAGLGLLTYGLLAGQRAEADGVALAEIGWTQVEVDAIDQRGQRSNRLAIVGGVVGGVGVAAGAALIALGIQRQRAAKSNQARLHPYGGAQGGGLVIEVEF